MDIIELDRIIVVSEDIDRSISEFSENLDLSFGEVMDSQPDGEPLKMTYGFPGIELVSPDDAGAGEMSRFLEKAGEGLYGAVFRVSDIKEAQEHLAARGIEPVLESASGGASSVFYHPEHFSGVFIVLTEYPHPLEREPNHRGER